MVPLVLEEISWPGIQFFESTPVGGSGGNFAFGSIGAWPFISGLTFQMSPRGKYFVEAALPEDVAVPVLHDPVLV